MKFQIGIIGILLTVMAGITRASNILGMFFTHSPSHVIVHMAVVRALVDRGHNVTVITSMPLHDPNPGYRHIFLKDLEVTQEEIDSLVNGWKDAPVYKVLFNSIFFVKNIVARYANFAADPAYISFLEEGNHFDLLLLGYAYNDFLLGAAAHFKCPTVLSWMVQPLGHVSRLIGNPTLPAFVPPAPFMDSGPMTFSGRVLSFVIDLAERSLSFGMGFFLEDLYHKNYPPDKYPSFTEMKRNISLILSNHHFSEGPVRPLVPGLVEIGGIQIKDKPDPLPEDINSFLEDSPQGAILFSLGSYAREDYLGPNALQVIHKVFSSLPYNIIWKSDSEKPSDGTKILYKKWLPQDDILAHKNLKLFVTHGGKGSVTESEYHGVPMVAIPILGDQPGNAETMQNKGHGVRLDYKTMTEESFRKAIVDVMKSENYRGTVQRFSKLYRDRPLTARENAVFWVEYVIRHRGAPHMQSPLKTMNFLQENSIDVILFLIFIVYVTFKVVKILTRVSVKIVKRMWRTCRIKRKVS